MKKLAWDDLINQYTVHLGEVSCSATVEQCRGDINDRAFEKNNSNRMLDNWQLSHCYSTIYLALTSLSFFRLVKKIISSGQNFPAFHVYSQIYSDLRPVKVGGHFSQ